MSVAFQADRSMASRNESVGLTVVARNNSSTPIDMLVIEILQLTRWSAGAHNALSERVLVSTSVPGIQLVLRQRVREGMMSTAGILH